MLRISPCWTPLALFVTVGVGLSPSLATAAAVTQVITDSGNGGQGIGWGQSVAMDHEHLLVSDSAGVISAYRRTSPEQAWQFQQSIARLDTVLSLKTTDNWLVVSSYGEGAAIYRFERESDAQSEPSWQLKQRLPEQTGEVTLKAGTLLIGDRVYQLGEGDQWQAVYRSQIPKPSLWGEAHDLLIGKAADSDRLVYEHAFEGWQNTAQSLVRGGYDGTTQLTALATYQDELLYVEERPERYLRTDSSKVLYNTDLRMYQEYTPPLAVGRAHLGDKIALLSYAPDHFEASQPDAKQPALLLDTHAPLTPVRRFDALALYDAAFHGRELLMSVSPATVGFEAQPPEFSHDSGVLEYYRADQYERPAQTLTSEVGAQDAYFSGVMAAQADRLVLLEAVDPNAHADGTVLVTYDFAPEGGLVPVARQVVQRGASEQAPRRVERAQLHEDQLWLLSYAVDPQGQQTDHRIDTYAWRDQAWQLQPDQALSPLSAAAGYLGEFVLDGDTLYVSGFNEANGQSELIVYRQQASAWVERERREGLSFYQGLKSENGVTLSNGARVFQARWDNDTLQVEPSQEVANRNMAYQGRVLLVAESESEVVGLYQLADDASWVRLGQITAPEPAQQFGTALSVVGKNVAISGLTQEGEARVWLFRQRDDNYRLYQHQATLNAPERAGESFGNQLYWHQQQLVATAPTADSDWGAQAGQAYVFGELDAVFNHPPTLLEAARQPVTRGEVLDYTVEVGDLDQDSVTLSLEGDDLQWAVLNGSTLRLAPPSDASVGEYVLTLSAFDGKARAEQVLTVVVLPEAGDTDADKTDASSSNSGNGLDPSNGGGGIVVWVLSVLGIAFAHRRRKELDIKF